MHVHGFSDQPSNGTLVVCGDTVSIVPVSACAAALCSQSLAVIRAAIPCIRAAVVSNLHPQHHGPVLGELDKVARVRLRLRLRFGHVGRVGSFASVWPTVSCVPVLQDYATHCERILAKIVQIVMDLTEKSCATFDVRAGKGWAGQDGVR